MKFSGECTSSVRNNGILKTTITIHSDKQPEYAYFNLIRERGEFQEGDIVEITIKLRRRPNPTAQDG